MTTTQVSPPRPLSKSRPTDLTTRPTQYTGHLRTRVSEPKWGMTMMLRDVAYLLRLTRRTSVIDF